MDGPNEFLEPGRERNELVIVLHGFSDAGTRMPGVREAVRAARADADIYAPPLPYARNRLCEQRPEAIVARLVRDVDELIAMRERAGGAYESIIVVGHSFGAVLARKLVIVAFGEQREPSGGRPAPFEGHLSDFSGARPWASRLKRLVLLAGMNRGWSASSALDWWTTILWSVGQLYGELVRGGKPTILAIRRGAPFLVQTRLQWLALMDPEYGPRPDLIAVQLLGTIDDQVSPDDNVDFSVDLFAHGTQSYFYLEVGQTNHANVIEMSEAGPPALAKARAERRTKFRLALDGDREALAASSITRAQMGDTLPPEPDMGVANVVFVVHGIRDKGFWTQKIARTIKRHAAVAGKRFESWTESYGYFAMLPFLLRTVRQRKVEWLMDRYAEARARYPRAEFHYVGHSNGTYLAAQALQDYPAARFCRVVFAGSVVRTDYDWLSLIRGSGLAEGQKSRVDAVLNYVASRDWVVALFPKALQRWRRANLGGAGHDGFDQGSPSGPVYQVEYIAGAHGAGHDEAHWDDIARFVVTGEAPALQYPPLRRVQNWFWRGVGKVSWILFPLLLLLVLAAAASLFWSIFASATPAAAGLRAMGFFAYVWLIYLIVTRV